MGTWAAGPFGNDSALDMAGEMVDRLMEPIDAFLANPEIDETFDEAFAALTLLNDLMTHAPSRPWDHERSEVRSAAPIVEALLTCFDEQIDSMDPDPSFKEEHREALVAECTRFTELME